MIGVPHEWVVKIYIKPDEDRDSVIEIRDCFLLEDYCEAAILGRKQKRGYPLTLKLKRMEYGDMMRSIQYIGDYLTDYEIVWPRTRWLISIGAVEDGMFNKRKNKILTRKKYDPYEFVAMDAGVGKDGMKRKVIKYGFNGTEKDLSDIMKIFEDSLYSINIMDQDIINEPCPEVREEQVRVKEDAKERSPVCEKYFKRCGKIFQNSYFLLKDDRGMEQKISLNGADYYTLPFFVEGLKRIYPNSESIELHYIDMNSRKIYGEVEKKTPPEVIEIAEDILKRHKKKSDIAKRKMRRAPAKRRRKGR